MTQLATTPLTVPTTTSRTRALLTGGIVAGPAYVAVVLAQAATRDGFDLTRHPASLLSNGAQGWIQITNFLVTGLLVIGAAVALRRTWRSGRGATWGPRLLALYGVGLVLAGIFRADPADGFPVGTPAGQPTEMHWSSIGHYVAGGIGFLSLIAACVVISRRFATEGRRGWAAYSVLTGVTVLVGFGAVSTGPAGVIAFSVAVLAGWTWIAALSILARSRLMP